MTKAEKELIALKRLLYQVNRFMWTNTEDPERVYMAQKRLFKAWMAAECRSKK